MTEIYGTLGPACNDEKILEAMFRSGMDGVRLNLSHTGLEKASDQIALLQKAAERCGKKAKLLLDMQGPELRIGVMTEPEELKEDSSVILGRGGIPVPGITLPYMQPGQEILLDDGKLLLKVSENMGESAAAQVLRGGILRGRKSIALPGTDIRPPALTESDRENIRLAPEFGVSGLMQPFVRNAEDLKEVREALNKAGGENIRIFAKIENLAGLKELPGIIDAADEIVIARGDLGNAVPLWELTGIQKDIARACREKGRAFMVVTQMLASMEHSPVPTRAEVSDIFNAVLDGADSVMVTGETAVGEYPVQVIDYLSRTARSACIYMEEEKD